MRLVISNAEGVEGIYVVYLDVFLDIDSCMVYTETFPSAKMWVV